MLALRIVFLLVEHRAGYSAAWLVANTAVLRAGGSVETLVETSAAPMALLLMERWVGCSAA
jgi:hypothetical protein